MQPAEPKSQLASCWFGAGRRGRSRASRRLQPGLIILDIGLPKLNGILAAYEILGFMADAKIVFVTQESSSEVIHETMNLGACGYVAKMNARRDLPIAVATIMAGRKFVSSGLPFYAASQA